MIPVVVFVLIIVFAPWKDWLIDSVKQRAAFYGVTLEAVSIDTIGGDRLVLREVEMRYDALSLSLPTVRVDYDLQEIWQVVMDEGKRLETIPVSESTAPFAHRLMGIPLRQLNVENATIRWTHAQQSLSMVADAEIGFGTFPTGQFALRNIIYSPSAGEDVVVPTANISLAPQDAQWKTEIGMTGVTMPDRPAIWTPVDVAAELLIDQETLSGPVSLTHEDYTLNTLLKHTIGHDVILEKITTLVAGGVIRADALVLSDADNWSTVLQCEKVDIEALLKLLAAQQTGVQATGTVSGILPIAVKNGMLVFDEGQLLNDAGGVIALSKQATAFLPSNIEQVGMVTQLLQQFNYKEFALRTKRDTNNQTQFIIALKGNNPNMYDGKEVHLNVNITGDVIQAITASLGMYKLPQEMLKGTP